MALQSNPGGVPEVSITDPGDIPDVKRGLRLRLQWRNWFIAIHKLLIAAASVIALVELTDQSAAIVTTVIPTGELNTSLYRISWYLRISQAASTSSSAQLTFGWTDDGVAITSSAAAVNGNTTGTVQSGSLFVASDFKKDLTYAVAYTSVGATPMKFKLSITVEEL